MYVLRGVATVGVVALALTLLCLPRRSLKQWRGPIVGIILACVAYKAFDLLRLAFMQVHHPPLWDFSVFWLAGHIAAAHHNVYDPASYRPYAALLNPGNDAEYNTIALQIGLPYPPPAILLMYPLGYFATVASGLAVWYVGIFAALGTGIVLLWRHYFSANGGAGLAVAALLVLGLSATRMTVALGQLNFFALLFLLLFWGERKAWRSGMWLGPLVILRPLTLVLAIYLLVRRQWNALGVFLATDVLLLVASIPLLGPHGFASYLHQNPTQRYPEIYFNGSQSLYKLLVAASHHYSGYFSLTAHPVFLILAVLSIAAATLVCAIAANARRDACLAMLLALALFLYPNTDTHYCVLLLVPLCALWRARGDVGVPEFAIFGVIVVTYLLLDVRDGNRTTGLTLMLDAAVFALLALRRPSSSADRISVEPSLAPT